jgi:hypothetical protein
MSQYVRRVIAALGLMAALLLAAPPPSRAAGLRELPIVPGFARAWAWLEGLWPGTPLEEKQESTASLTSPATPVPPPTGTSDEGSAIDPNGRR